MHLSDYILEIEPLGVNTNRQEAIDAMLDLKTFQLPVLKDNELYGTVDLDECIYSSEDTIEQLIDPGYLSVHFHAHTFDVLNLIQEAQTDVCCVLNEDKSWVGLVTKNDLLKGIASSLTSSQDGVIILAEMASHQYSASEISRIIENEGSQLLGLIIENVPESGRIRASLKLNTKNAERIVTSLRRYGYDVIFIFGDEDYKENVEKRFESLMKYIDI